MVNQNCGQTWLATLNEIGSYYNSGQQLDSIQIPTWNDYEEGDEIETWPMKTTEAAKTNTASGKTVLADSSASINWVRSKEYHLSPRF